MSVSLIDDLKTSRRILENIGQPHEFIIATIDKAIEKLTPQPTRMHSCDIPGCLSCGNPPDSDDW